MQPTPKRIVAGALLILGLLAVIAAVVSWFAYPEWRAKPVGALSLIMVALGGTALIAKNVLESIKAFLELIEKIRSSEGTTPKSYQTPYSQYFYKGYCDAPGKDDLTPAEFDQALWSYLDWVQKEYSEARLFASRVPQGEQLPTSNLGDIFIPLKLRKTTPPDPEEVRQHMKDQHLDEQHRYLSLMQQRRKEGYTVALRDLLAINNRLAIIGGAGCGKSTLAKYLAYSLAEAGMTGQSLPYQLPENTRVMLPILIPLRNYRIYKREKKVDTLQDYIITYINDRSLKLHLQESFFERLLQASDCLLILDGLDEVVSKGDRQEVREIIESMARAIYPRAFFLVTAREAGYQENAIFGKNFTRLDVQDLEPEEIDTLVINWCRQIRRLEDKADEIITSIREINQLYTDQNLPPLIATPLMVTMVISARWSVDAKLPRDRVRLYDLVVWAILSSLYSEEEGKPEVINFGGPWEHQKQWLARLALEMHQGGQAGAAVPESRVRKILSGAIPTPGGLDQFIEAIRYRGSLFEERNELFQFVHLTFQEYLAAVRINESRENSFKFLAKNLLDSWWREVFLLAHGYAAIYALEFFARYREWLNSQPGNGPERMAGRELAGAALLEIEEPDPEMRKAQAELLKSALIDPQLNAPASLRARAGDTLARLGDPRFDPQRWHLPAEPLLGFVEIPAGEFLMGSKKEDDPEADSDEFDQHPVHLETYYIARYPVTVAQFADFMSDPARPAVEVDADALRGLPNHPVTEVTWHNALAYCRWLEGKLKALAPQRLEQIKTPSERAFWQGLAAGILHVSLPSEAEWEKAARGMPRTSAAPPGALGVMRGKGIYPWGDAFDPEKANAFETGIGRTSAVGCFPAGASPYGILDLSGNVWEWTRSVYGRWDSKKGKYTDVYAYPYRLDDGREKLDLPGDYRRVLRGGSFGYDRRRVRCAFRDWSDPDLRGITGGFRVVVSPF